MSSGSGTVYWSTTAPSSVRYFFVFAFLIVFVFEWNSILRHYDTKKNISDQRSIKTWKPNRLRLTILWGCSSLWRKLKYPPSERMFSHWRRINFQPFPRKMFSYDLTWRKMSLPYLSSLSFLTQNKHVLTFQLLFCNTTLQWRSKDKTRKIGRLGVCRGCFFYWSHPEKF